MRSESITTYCMKLHPCIHTDCYRYLQRVRQVLHGPRARLLHRERVSIQEQGVEHGDLSLRN